MKVTIYSDGSSLGNPGPGGYGSIIHFVDQKGEKHIREYSGGFSYTTNNRMELMGAIVALEALIKPCEVELISDSKYVTDAFNQKWIDNWQKKNWKHTGTKMVPNTDLWKRLLAVVKKHKVTFVWVKGHNGHPENERCDELARTAAAQENLSLDQGMPL